MELPFISAVRNKGAVFSWALYDFANTIFSMNILTLYFAGWVIIDHGLEDIWYSLTFSGSMLLATRCTPGLLAPREGPGARWPA